MCTSVHGIRCIRLWGVHIHIEIVKTLDNKNIVTQRWMWTMSISEKIVERRLWSSHPWKTDTPIYFLSGGRTI